MPSFDLLMSLLVFTQPVFVLAVLLSLTSMSNASTYFLNLKVSRKKLDDVKFYECASPVKHLNKFVIELNSLAFIFMFVIYDIDLLFLISELLIFDQLTVFEWVILCSVLSLFVFGLLYDFEKNTLFWF